MNKPALHDDIINAYIDGNLDANSSHRLLQAMHTDPQLRKRVCELQEAKAWVSIAFADATPPEHNEPASAFPRHSWMGRAAAVLLVLTLGFIAGWQSQYSGHSEHTGVQLSQVAASNHRVLLHIDEADKSKFAEVLDEAEYLLNTYQARGIKVEVMANASGLDLLRVGVSPYEKRVARLINEYPNLQFIACANSIARARERGEDVQIFDQINTQPTAIDHTIQRLQEGWTYIQI